MRLAEAVVVSVLPAQLVVRGGIEPPAFRFQAHPRRRHTWLDEA